MVRVLLFERGQTGARLNDEVEAGTIEPISEDAPYPHYPPGVYEAQCVRARIYRDPQFKSWKALLDFRLILNREPVCAFFNLGNKEHPHAGRRSEYRRVWIMAKGRQPGKRQVLSTRVFKGKLFEVRVEDVIRRFDGRGHPSGAIYSVVREIVRRTYP